MVFHTVNAFNVQLQQLEVQSLSTEFGIINNEGGLSQVHFVTAESLVVTPIQILSDDDNRK